MPTAALPLFLALLGADPPSSAEARRPFVIEVVDDRTGRGVPLVELRTVNEIKLFTDSAGVVAFDEPGLMDRKVFFHVRSHGYEFPADGFGYRGRALDVRPGGSARLEIRRINVAERLYRVTGAGIYRDSVLSGRPAPIRKPVLDGQVLGSDSVLAAVYGGTIHWFWGDTNRPGYPLGNFHTPGATSRLPADGGLDPEVGVDLNYFVGPDGFARPTAPMPGDGPTWLGGLVVLRDGSGRERMFAGYSKIRPPLEPYERGLCEWDEGAKVFRKVATFPLAAPNFPTGHPFLKREADGEEYAYFATPYPLVRVKADPESLARPESYEAFTCLSPGSRLDRPSIERDREGRPVYAWRRDTPAVGPRDQAKLIRAGHLKPGEALLALRDVATGKPVVGHAGSVAWNEYRGRWVMIACEVGGTSLLGETWYAEADTPLGPWAYARKVVTHEKYDFYNPKHHPFFDKDGGRVLFFEGTYTKTFSGNPEATPRYDYNQVMYRLDLSDPRLNLPVAISQEPATAPAGDRFLTALQSTGARGGRPAFFALERPGAGTVPVYQASGDQGHALKAGEPPEALRPRVRFHAIPADAEEPPPETVPLWEYRVAGGEPAYSTDPALTAGERSERPVCRVWRNPMGIGVPIDPAAQPRAE